MLNRMSLPVKNSWYDEQGRVYIYCTAEETREDLRCGNGKALKLLAELDVKKGFGLIERIKQRQGRPTKRYALNISPPGRSRNRLPSRSSEVQTSTFPASRPRKNRYLSLDKSEVLTSKNQIHLLSVIGSEIVLLTVYNRLDVAIIAALAGTNFEYNFDNLFENLISPATGT